MSKASKSIVSNFFYNVSFELFKIIVPLVTTPYISRILGATGVGTYTLAHTYAQYYILIAGFGFAIYGARELAYVRDDKDKFRTTFWELFIIRVFFLLCAVVIYWAYFWKISIKTDVSYRICVIYIVASIFDFSYYYKAIEDFKTIAIRNFIIKGASLVFIFTFVKQANQVWLYTLILAVSEFIGQAIMVVSLDKSLFMEKPNIKKVNFLKHFKASFALFIPTLAIQVYSMLDKVMLGFMVGDSSVGFYENAQKMVRLASTIPSAIVAVSTPHIAYLYAKGLLKEMKNHFSKVFRFVSFLAFPMCFGLISIAENFSSWFYGEGFDGIYKLVIVGAVLIISLAWSGALGNMILIATNNQKYYTISVYIGAILNICMNLYLIPKIGAMGAIIASDVAELSGMLLMFYFCNKLYGVFKDIVLVWHYLLSGFIMYIILEIVSTKIEYSVLSTLFLILVGIGIYFLCLLILHDDYINQMLKKFKGRKVT